MGPIETYYASLFQAIGAKLVGRQQLTNNINLSIQYEAVRFEIIINERNANQLAVRHDQIYNDLSSEQLLMLLTCANAVNSDIYGAKVYVGDSQENSRGALTAVSFTVEAVLPSLSDAEHVFMQYLHWVVEAYGAFSGAIAGQV